MSNLNKLGVMLLLLFTLLLTIETSAQIHEIKKKSSSNKSKRSSSSSSYSSSSSKKKSSRSRSSRNSSESDVSASDVFGCISSFFDMAGCLINAIESSESSGSGHYSSNDYSYDNYKPEDHFENNTITEEPCKVPEKTDTEIKTEDPPIIKESDYGTLKKDKLEIADNKAELVVNEINTIKDTLKRKEEVSLDVRAHFDLSINKGIDKNYVHVDYLPGLRANFDFFLIDFRYNILTEYTDDFPDSFKSWEILALFNITARQDYSIIIGTGLQREQFDEGISFHEYYLGTKIPLKNKQDYIDIDTRFSRDYKTDEFPFFEFGGRYNVRFLNEKNFSGYFTFGATYQNYYRSYDIWGIRGGVLVNIH